MRSLIPFLALAFLPAMSIAGNSDPVVMTVAGTDVRQSEFEYFLNRNRDTDSNASVMDYAEMYVNFKLKVQAAIDAGVDTTAQFLSEYAEYRDMQAAGFMLDSVFLEETAKASYEESVKEIGPDGLSYVNIISIAPSNDSPAEYERCIGLADSIYSLLMDGADFPSLAGRYSNDNYAAQRGEVGWMSRNQLPDVIWEAVSALEPGQISRPFFHEGVSVIVWVSARRQLGSYEENRDEIYKWMDSKREIMRQAMLNRAMQYSEQYGWGIGNQDSALYFMVDSLEYFNQEFGNIAREYHDGLLLFESSNVNVWDKALNDDEGMGKFFEQNRKMFRFNEPCFKGMVFFCTAEDVFHQIEKAVDGLPVNEWADTIITFNREQSQVRAMRGNKETGIFEKGSNVYVDKLVFGEGSFEPMKGFPYAGVIGKVLKEPETMEDVASTVAQAYQDSLEQEWISKLRSQYKYKINKKVLKKLNTK